MEAICYKNKSFRFVELNCLLQIKMKGRDTKTASEATKSSPAKHIIQIKMKHSFEKGVTHTPNSSC